MEDIQGMMITMAKITSVEEITEGLENAIEQYKLNKSRRKAAEISFYCSLYLTKEVLNYKGEGEMRADMHNMKAGANLLNLKKNQN